MITFEHFDRFFVLVAVGLGLVCAGGLNLVLGGRGGRVALRLVASLIACGVVVAALYSITRAELAARAAGVLGVVLFASAAFGSAWLHRQLAALVAVVRRPAVRGGLLTLGGLVLVLGSVVGFERADEDLADKSTAELEITLGQQPRVPSTRTHAATDRGTAVVLKEPTTARDPAVLSDSEEKVLQNSHLADQVIRHGAPTDASNCHGWVFTGGKFLLSPEDVEIILKDNGYAETREPEAGDVAIYRLGGAISHTALVRYASPGQPVMVEGKWGTMGVFLHAADKSLYGTDITFYHSDRHGHLLAGLDDNAPDASGVMAASE